MKKQAEGAITVFLSLVLLLILSLVMTSIEVARVSSYRFVVGNTMKSSMDSLLCDFYRPLYDTYHIFAFDGGYGEPEVGKERIEDNVGRYMKDTFEPEKDFEINILKKYFHIYGIDLEKVEVKNYETLLDRQGAWYRKQAVDYMKYKSVSSAVEKLLANRTIMKHNKETIKVLDKKQTVEEEAVKIEKEVLDLMSLIDGIGTGKNGLAYTEDGFIQTKHSFSKKLCPYPITSESVHINNEWVFQSLKEGYYNPIAKGNEIMIDIDAYISNYRLKEEAKEVYDSLMLADRSLIEKGEDLLLLEQEIQSAKQTLEYYEKAEKILVDTIKEKRNEMIQVLDSTIKSNKKGVNKIDSILNQSKGMEGKIVEYERSLFESREGLDSHIYAELLEDMEPLKRFKKGGHYDREGTNFTSMKEELLSNQVIVKNVKNSISMYQESSYEEMVGLKSALASFPLLLKEYSFAHLFFDYSTFRYSKEQKEKGEAIGKSISSLLKTGLLGIVLEQNKNISDKVLIDKNLPSKDKGHVPDEKKEGFGDKGAVDLENSGQFLKSFYGLFSDMNYEELGDSIGHVILFQEYLKEHFLSFTSHIGRDGDESKNGEVNREAEGNKEAGRSKETEEGIKEAGDIADAENVLLYEMEYILSGHYKDLENLNQVVMSMLLIRTVSNFITIFSDSGIRNEAGIIAAGILGFTGMPFLINTLKYAILLFYSIGEAMVDMAALLKGGGIPIIKGKGDVCLKLEDLIGLTKEKIHLKADEVNSKNKGFSADYNDYISLLLFTKLKEIQSYRSLDLIQENVRLRHNKNFYIKNTLPYIQVESECNMKGRFSSLSFVQSFLQDSIDLHIYSLTMEAAY